MKKFLSFLLVTLMIIGILPIAVFAATPTVTVVNYRTQQGEDVENFRCSSLLEVKTSGFKEGAALTYTYTTTLNASSDDEIAVYNTPDMYAATDSSSREQYQSSNEGDTFTSAWKYFTVCGRNGNRLITDAQLEGKIVTVTVTDGETTATWTNKKDFKQASLADDMKDLTYGMFTGDSITLKRIFGLNAVTHISCSNCSVSSTAPADTNVATISDNTLTAVSKGETTFDATVNKSTSCIMHAGQRATSTTTVYVFQTPTATSTNTTITLTNLQPGLSYTVNGVTKVAGEGDTELVFDGLKADTSYTIHVSATYEGKEVTKDISKRTTKDTYIHLMFNDQPISAAALYGEGAKIYDRASIGGILSDYYLSTVVDEANGVYQPQNDGIWDYRNFYYRIGSGSYVRLRFGTVLRDNGKDYYENYYSVSYALPEGVSGIELPDTVIVYAGESATVGGIANAQGRVFKEWTDGKGHNYAAGDTITDITSQVILTAVFKDQYTISFAKAGLDENKDNIPDISTLIKPEGSVITINPGDGKYNGQSNPAPIALSENTTIANPVKANAVFAGWTAVEGDDYSVTLTANYLDDYKGDNGTSDGIPDKYQAEVTFKIENGLWTAGGNSNDKKVYVTLADSDGKWNAAGAGHLTAAQIPAEMEANAGYGNGSWGDKTPLTATEITADAEYVYTFTRILNVEKHISYISGYPDGTVRPENNITRAEAAMLFYRLLTNQDVQTTVSFSDVEAGEWYTVAIETLATLKIINGYPDGTFLPDEYITRAEFTAMSVRFAQAQEQEVPFTDVPDDHWAKAAIGTAVYYGWISGYPDGTFHPEDNITRAEVATFVNRMLGRKGDKTYIDAHIAELQTFSDLKDTEWYYYDMMEAINAHDYVKETEDADETWREETTH